MMIEKQSKQFAVKTREVLTDISAYSNQPTYMRTNCNLPGYVSHEISSFLSWMKKEAVTDLIHKAGGKEVNYDSPCGSTVFQTYINARFEDKIAYIVISPRGGNPEKKIEHCEAYIQAQNLENKQRVPISGLEGMFEQLISLFEQPDNYTPIPQEFLNRQSQNF